MLQSIGTSSIFADGSFSGILPSDLQRMSLFQDMSYRKQSQVRSHQSEVNPDFNVKQFSATGRVIFLGRFGIQALEAEGHFTTTT